MDWLSILTSEGFLLGIMAVIIFFVTQGLKQFIKLGTKYIKNDRIRKIVNSTILLIPFGLGVLCEFLYGSYIYPCLYEGEILTFTGITGLSYGTAGISLYGVVERFFKVKTNNPYNTDEGKIVTNLIDNITEDKKIDSNDKSAVQEFLDKVGK